MARLLADENFPLPAAIALREFDHDVVTLQEAGFADRATVDEAVLALATSQGRAILTLNRRHFVRLHTMTPHHAGIVVCSADRNFIALAARIHTAIGSAGDLAGQLIRVNRPPS